MRLLGSLAGLITIALLAGCNSSSAPSIVSSPLTLQTNPSSPAASRTAPGTPAPAELYAQARTALISAASARFNQQSISNVGDGSVTVQLDGNYDLKARIWQGREQYQSDSASYLASVPDPAKLTADYREIGPNAYLSRPAWPVALRGRWQQVESKKSFGVAASLAAGPKASSPETLAALLALTPTAVQPSGSGWILTGTVGGNRAIYALGLAKAFRSKNVNVVSLTGSGTVSVTIGADRLPTELQIEGTSVTLPASVPAELRTMVSRQRGILHLSDFGQRVSVPEPTGRQLIGASELKSPTSSAP